MLTKKEIKAIKLAGKEESFEGFEKTCNFSLMKRMWLSNDIKSLEKYEVEHNTEAGLIRRCFSFDEEYIYMRVMYFPHEGYEDLMFDSREAYRKLR